MKHDQFEAYLNGQHIALSAAVYALIDCHPDPERLLRCLEHQLGTTSAIKNSKTSVAGSISEGFDQQSETLLRLAKQCAGADDDGRES